MEIPLQITFRDIPHSDALEEHARKRGDKLDALFDRIIRCHVVVEAPHRQHQQGTRFRIRVDMTVPGQELVVSRSPDGDPRYENAHVALDDAFDDAERLVEGYLQKLRHEVKRSSKAPHGRVIRLFAEEGYGFLEAPDDGHDVYFHRNSVLHNGFGKLRVGTEVRFAEENGDKGPQASTVAIVGH